MNDKNKLRLLKKKLLQKPLDFETWREYSMLLRHVSKEKEAALAELRSRQVQRFNPFEKYEALEAYFGPVTIGLWGEVLRVTCGLGELWGVAEQIQQFMGSLNYEAYPWLDEINNSLPRLIEDVAPALATCQKFEEGNLTTWLISEKERLDYLKEEDFYWLHLDQ